MVWNKTLRRGNVHKIDIGFWNTYYSLLQLGHQVHFFDTTTQPEKSLSDVVDSFKPELIYCCMTGDPSLTPYEPWEDIEKETQKGRCKTSLARCVTCFMFALLSRSIIYRGLKKLDTTT